MDLKPSRFVNYIVTRARNSKSRWDELQVRSKCSIKTAIISNLLTVFFLAVYFYIIPYVSEKYIIQKLQLRNGSIALSLWHQPPIPIVTRVYLWNLSNPLEVASGLAPPQFQEIGPYVFDQFKEKIPTEYKQDSIVYYARSLFKFRKDLTTPATLDDTVTTLHSALYGTALLLEKMAPSLLNKSLPHIFPNVNSIFTPLRVGSYLFDGLPFDCSAKESAFICKNLPTLAPPTIRQKEGSSDYLYSFLAYKNYTLEGPFEEHLGLSNILLRGKLLHYRNRTSLGVWKKDSHCDQLHGTDGSIFPPFVQKKDRIDIYIPDICQSLSIIYEKDDVLKGVSVYKFSLPDLWLASVDKNPDNKCYCIKNNFCNSEGVRDVAPCVKMPVIISQPHFYSAEEHFRNYALGMNPNRELHTSVLYIEPQTGIFIQAAKRIQLNIYVRRLKGLKMDSNVSEGLFPLLWYEESIHLSEPFITEVKHPLIIQWWAYLISVILLVTTLLITVCSLFNLIHQQKTYCCNIMWSNQVTVMYKPESDVSSGIQNTMRISD